MLMKIAVCDDEALFRAAITKVCIEFGNSYGCNYEFMEFESGEELLSCSENIDIVFLDIELPGIGGIEVKERVEERNNINYIIFMTSHKEAIWKAFGRKTLGYLAKPVEEQRLYTLLEKVQKETSHSILANVLVNVLDGNLTVSISSNHIVYMKADNIYSEIITTNKSYLTRQSLKEWEASLEQAGFCRIHKSYLINMAYVKYINNKIVILLDGAELNISRNKAEQFKKAYNNYIRKRSH